VAADKIFSAKRLDKPATDSNSAAKVRAQTDHRRLQLSFIPEELKREKRWVDWKQVPCKDKPGEFKKVPINPATGNNASTIDPKTWDRFEAAVRRFQRGDLDGIGFVLSEPYAAVDLDDCRDPTSGRIQDWALKIVADINTYTEVSPSGTGLHLILKGTLPPGGNVRKMGKGKIEIYDSHHYFTVTGRRLKGRPHSIKDRDAELHRLHGNLFGKTVKEKNVEAPALPAPSPEVVKTLVSRISSMKESSRLKKLWEGNWKTKHPSRSEADLALCTQLALKFGCDSLLVDALFRQSRLFRPKWDEVHSADGRSYGQMTVRTAITTATKRFKEKHNVHTTTELNAQLKILGDNSYIVEGMIPARSLGLLVGDSGIGKSAYLYQMALCVTAGTSFLGHAVTRGKVLYCDFENGLPDVDTIISGLMRHLGLTTRPTSRRLLLWNFNDPLLEGRFKREDVLQMVRDFRPSLAIVDSLSSYHPDAERNNPAAARTLRELRATIRDSGASIICVHHIRKSSTKKNEAPEPLEGDMRRWFQEPRGAGALINASDVRIGVAEPRSARPGKDNEEIAFLTRGFARVHGEIPTSYIARSLDNSGMPLGYTKLAGVHLLFNLEQEAAYHRLPKSFRFKGARQAYGKASQSTDNFLKKCIALDILRKTHEGYTKINQK
jgi:putative DNA primase/helicase